MNEKKKLNSKFSISVCYGIITNYQVSQNHQGLLECNRNKFTFLFFFSRIYPALLRGETAIRVRHLLDFLM